MADHHDELEEAQGTWRLRRRRHHSEGHLEERLAHLTKPKLLIIDELGYLPFERRAAHLLFQLVNRRYERGSLVLTSNQPVGNWGEVFGELFRKEESNPQDERKRKRKDPEAHQER